MSFIFLWVPVFNFYAFVEWILIILCLEPTYEPTYEPTTLPTYEPSYEPSFGKINCFLFCFVIVPENKAIFFAFLFCCFGYFIVTILFLWWILIIFLFRTNVRAHVWANFFAYHFTYVPAYIWANATSNIWAYLRAFVRTKCRALLWAYIW